MTDESVLDEMLSAGDYEIVMCVLFAEVLAGEMTEQYRNLRMEALMHLRSVLAQYQKRMYHDSLLLISSFFIAFCMKSHLYCYLHTYACFIFGDRECKIYYKEKQRRWITRNLEEISGSIEGLLT